MESPSTAALKRDYASGIWWLDPAAGPGASLVLPALPAGWIYEGWVVGPEGPVSTGRFTQVMGADSDAGGPTAGPRSTPPFPGQDFIMPPVSLIGYQAVVSIEPDPDDSPGPFTFEAAGGHEHSRRWAGRPPAHGQHGDRLPNRDRYPLICVLRAGRQSEAGSPTRKLD